MEDAEAEAVLESLWSSLTWVRSGSRLSIEAVGADADDYFLLGFLAAEIACGERHRFVLRLARTTPHWTASVFPGQRKTQIRARRKTLGEVKAACEYYLEAGNWENVDPEPFLVWSATDPARRTDTEQKSRLLYRAVGRNLQYRVLEVRWLCFFRRYFVICDDHQCVRGGDRAVTREHGYGDGSLPDCMAKIGDQRFWSVAAAQAACDRHHTTGKWE